MRWDSTESPFGAAALPGGSAAADFAVRSRFTSQMGERTKRNSKEKAMKTKTNLKAGCHKGESYSF